jgi:hypothetical protein
MLSLCGFPIASVYFKSCYWTIVNILYQHETIPPKLNFLHTRVKTGKGHCPLVNDYHVCNNKLQSYFVLPLHKHSHTYCLHTRTYTPTKRFRRAGLYFDKDALTAVWIYWHTEIVFWTQGRANSGASLCCTFNGFNRLCLCLSCVFLKHSPTYCHC